MEEKPNYYAIIPADVRYDKTLKDKAKLLYGEITCLSNENGYCFASNKYFANLYQVSTTTISLLIKNLVDNGYITSEIIYKDGSKEILSRYLKISKEGYLKNLKEGIKENLKDNNTSINNTSINNIYFSDTKLNEVFNEWLSYKKEKKSSYQKSGLDKLISRINRELENHSVDDLVNVINESMENNYQGITFNKLKQIPNKPKKIERNYL